MNETDLLEKQIKEIQSNLNNVKIISNEFQNSYFQEIQDQNNRCYNYRSDLSKVFLLFIIQLDLDNFKNQVNVLGLENHVNTLDKENANNKVKISELLTQIELLKDENSKIVNEKDNIIKDMNDEHLQLMYFFLIQEFNTQIRK